MFRISGSLQSNEISAGAEQLGNQSNKQTKVLKNDPTSLISKFRLDQRISQGYKMAYYRVQDSVAVIELNIAPVNALG